MEKISGMLLLISFVEDEININEYKHILNVDSPVK